MKARTVTEYRVVSTRRVTHLETGQEYDQRTEKRYASLPRVRDRIGILTSDEPWRFWGTDTERKRGPDEYACCPGTYGNQCACGGQSLREATVERRKDLPPIVSVMVQKRTVTRTAWEPCEGE